MSDSKSVKIHYDVAGDDFDRAGEASAGLKRLLQKIGVPADIIRRIAIGTYEAEMNVIIHAGGGQVDAEIFLKRRLYILLIRDRESLTLNWQCRKAGLQHRIM